MNQNLGLRTAYDSKNNWDGSLNFESYMTDALNYGISFTTIFDPFVEIFLKQDLLLLLHYFSAVVNVVVMLQNYEANYKQNWHFIVRYITREKSFPCARFVVWYYA